MIVIYGGKFHGLRLGKRTPRNEFEIVFHVDGESLDGRLLIGESLLHDRLDVRRLIDVRGFVSQHVDVEQPFRLVFEGVDLMRNEDVFRRRHVEVFDEDAVGFAHDVESVIVLPASFEAY